MTTPQTKPAIFISYAHADEPENRARAKFSGSRSCLGTFGLR
jgi:hypothetical protein